MLLSMIKEEMGISRERFCFAPSDDIICPVCSGVLKDAVNFKKCNHLVCRGCLDQLKCVSSKYLCASCSKYSAIKELHPLLKKLIDQWPLKCKYAENGCNFVTSVLNDDSHAADCKFNPWKKDTCLECGFTGFLHAKNDHHNCVKYLMQELKISKFEIEKLRRDQMSVRRPIRPNFGSSEFIIDKNDRNDMNNGNLDASFTDIKSSLTNFYNRRMEQMSSSLRIKNAFDNPLIGKSNTIDINHHTQNITRPPRRKVPPVPPSPPARRTRSNTAKTTTIIEKHAKDYHQIVLDLAKNILTDGSSGDIMVPDTVSQVVRCY